MDAILLLGHGSPLCGSERNQLALATRLRESDAAPIVEAAFLHHGEPDFGAAVARCVTGGATRIVVAPFLLGSGVVASELNDRVVTASRQHPSIVFVMAEPIGFHLRLVDAVLESAREARPLDQADARLNHLEDHCRDDTSCPMYGSESCRAEVELSEVIS